MARIEHPRLGSAPDRLVDLSDVAPTRGPSVISTTHVGDALHARFRAEIVDRVVCTKTGALISQISSRSFLEERM